MVKLVLKTHGKRTQNIYKKVVSDQEKVQSNRNNHSYIAYIDINKYVLYIAS